MPNNVNRWRFDADAARSVIETGHGSCTTCPPTRQGSSATRRMPGSARLWLGFESCCFILVPTRIVRECHGEEDRAPRLATTAPNVEYSYSTYCRVLD